LISEPRSYQIDDRKLHNGQNHPDAPLLDHARELIEQMEAMGIKSCSVAEDGEDEEKWDDIDSDGDDVQMG
jgi:hypothetical protein